MAALQCNCGKSLGAGAAQTPLTCENTATPAAVPPLVCPTPRKPASSCSTPALLWYRNTPQVAIGNQQVDDARPDVLANAEIHEVHTAELYMETLMTTLGSLQIGDLSARNQAARSTKQSLQAVVILKSLIGRVVRLPWQRKQGAIALPKCCNPT